MPKKVDQVCRFSVGGVLVDRVSLEAALALIAAGTASVKHGTRTKLYSITDQAVSVDSRPGGPALKTVYRESLGNTRFVHTSMRPDGHGGFCRWDQNLTFKELREGRHVGRLTLDQRKKQQSLRG